MAVVLPLFYTKPLPSGPHSARTESGCWEKQRSEVWGDEAPTHSFATGLKPMCPLQARPLLWTPDKHRGGLSIAVLVPAGLAGPWQLLNAAF